jgi:hypothetical protein
MQHKYSFDGEKTLPLSALRGRDRLFVEAFQEALGAGLTNVSVVKCTVAVEQAQEVEDPDDRIPRRYRICQEVTEAIEWPKVANDESSGYECWTPVFSPALADKAVCSSEGGGNFFTRVFFRSRPCRGSTATCCLLTRTLDLNYAQFWSVRLESVTACKTASMAGSCTGPSGACCGCVTRCCCSHMQGGAASSIKLSTSRTCVCWAVCFSIVSVMFPQYFSLRPSVSPF